MVKTPGFHCRGAWVRSLVQELRSPMLHSMAKINKNNFVLKTSTFGRGRGVWGVEKFTGLFKNR